MKKAMLLVVFTALFSICFCGKTEAIVCPQNGAENSMADSSVCRPIMMATSNFISKDNSFFNEPKEPNRNRFLNGAIAGIILTTAFVLCGGFASFMFFLFAIGIGECKPNTDCSIDKNLFAIGLLIAVATIVLTIFMIRGIINLFKKHKQLRKTKTTESPR